jgi:periplasmic divalent cation tolerance protein
VNRGNDESHQSLRGHDDRIQQGTSGENRSGGLEARLAACVQIQEITSYYWWNDKVNHEPEQLLYLKTTSDKYQALEALLIANHSYDTPEILQLPVEAGFEKNLSWMQKEIR